MGILLSSRIDNDHDSNHRTENDEHAALWRRLLAHPFESPNQSLSFTARLAREQGWSLADARTAIDEYRKFCFLAATSSRHVTPSEQVDEVWHLHLIYSRDYWQTFCPHVLRCDLHHGPTAGGGHEAARYREQYGETLRRYEDVFGTPPARWWPSRRERFANAAMIRRVDLRRHWVVKKPQMPSAWASLSAMLGTALIAIPSVALALPSNPLNWPASPFLTLFALACLLSIVIAAITRRSGRSAGNAVLYPELTVAEFAYLAGGAERAADAAVTELLAQKSVAWENRELRPTGTMAVLDPSAAEALRCVKANPVLAVALPRIIRAMQPIRERLIRRQLWLDEATSRRLAGMSAIAPLAVAAMGAAKIMLALEHGKPFGFLLVLTIIIAIVGLAFAIRRPGRSREGDALLRNTKSRQSVLMRAPNDDQLALAVALGGTAILANTMFADYHRTRFPPTDSSSSGDGSSSSDSSGDGSGGGGCGGCGGGD